MRMKQINIKNHNEQHGSIDQVTSCEDLPPIVNRESLVEREESSASYSDSTTCSLNTNYCNKRTSVPSEVTTLLKRETRQSQRMHFRFDRQFFKERSVIVDILVIFFAIGTWVGINGTFMQMPLLVEVAPEGWTLPSYLSVMVQMGNLGPLAYTLMQHFYKKNDAYYIYGKLGLAAISALLTAFFFGETSTVFGANHSVALFVLTFFTAITACTSSVVSMPYMGRFKEMYLVTYFIGEGLSGLIPSVIALIQGIGGTPQCKLINVTSTGEEIYEKYLPPPRFDTKLFFIFIFILTMLSCLGFFLLDHLKLIRTQYADVKVTHGNEYIYEANNNNASTGKDKNRFNQLPSRQYRLLLSLMCMINLLANGVVSSIQSYSSLPYGSQAYHLSATLSVMANPLACFLAMFLPHTSIRGIYTLTGLASLMTIYVLVTAILSPFPPLHGTTEGAIIVVITWTLLMGVISYIKLSITTVMRSQGGKSLVWTGGLSQLGSLIGSLVMFVIINFTNTFKAAEEKGC